MQHTENVDAGGPKGWSLKEFLTPNMLVQAVVAAAIGVVLSYPFSILASLHANEISKETTFSSLAAPLRSGWFWLRFLPFFFITFALILSLRRRQRVELINSRLERECVELKSASATLEAQVKALQENCEELRKSFPAGWEGIEKTGFCDYIPKLEGSLYHPSNCLNEIKHDLDFMGHGARKWTSHPTPLESMLNIAKRRGGKIRFLIFNPIEEEDQEEAKEIAISLLKLKELQSKYNNLQVQVYSHPPQFRLMFIDGKTLVLGHYKGDGRGDSKDSPLYVFTENPDWSFYYAFKSHFEAEWEAAVGKGEPDWEKIKGLRG